MKCREVIRIVKYGRPTPAGADLDVTEHAQNCPACRDLVSLDRMVSAVIRARRARAEEIEQDILRPFWVNKIRNRVQEVREQYYNSWESAVATTRSWLAAFAAAAVILIIISIWQPPASTSDFDREGDESSAQNQAEYLISGVPDSTSEE